jgi:serine/threonine-protein kinase HipA
LKLAAARAEAQRVAEVVAGWRAHFSSSGVRPGDIELIAEHVDRPFLREQREHHAPRA